ncbi:MAG: alanine--tRNA ligase [Verrucomicrobiales bacterium]|nr:alanine--tRNA ligase [Verrucomicrobiales bacterium]
MKAAEVRKSFLEFFKGKGHTVVPSASLMPTSPNLLFTNAGMNQFVPYFLGTAAAPYDPPRAADTQKCIRAGGKHNDLEDVGYDTYHHTLFEMLGNWSFGDYFKQEAIGWAWELLTEVWGFPPSRLYASVYKPGEGDPADFDQEAYDYWKAIFEKAGLDPDVHIVTGGKADNFWMMGETGPCGPCSELHIDLTPEGDSKGALVNMDDPRCIEIWNLVFIQYNAEEGGGFRPLPACHVDTGMGFERVCSVMQCTNGFTDFVDLASNYNTDVFEPIFEAIAKVSGKPYGRTMPDEGVRVGLGEEQQRDVAFRVIADHLRTLSFSIADGILPGNTDRNYVLRRILRRAVRYGRTLGLGEGGEVFLSKLLPALVEQMGGVFAELVKRQEKIAEVLDAEETSFNRTLDRGIKLFEKELEGLKASGATVFPGEVAFRLSDTFGFPLDLTQLMAREKGLEVDEDAYEIELKKQQERGGAKGSVVRALNVTTAVVTQFTGYDDDECEAKIEDVLVDDGKTYLVVDKCPLYVEMGGQLGDTGVVHEGGEELEVKDVLKIQDAIALEVEAAPEAWGGEPLDATVRLDGPRRRGIEGHHTATHLLHWALHRVVGDDVAQQGSLVAPDRLRFDFNSTALNSEQVEAVEQLVNEKVNEDHEVSWKEVPHDDVKGREDVMQFFGDKYGDLVRVVQIGGNGGELNGFSMELCGGTHVRRTSSVGRFVIKSEGAIAAGVRRVEAVCGGAAVAYLEETTRALKEECEGLVAKLGESNTALAAAGGEAVAAPDAAGGDDLGELTEYRDALKAATVDADKRLKKAQAGAAAKVAEESLGALMEAAGAGGSIVEAFDGPPALLQELLTVLKKKGFAGAAFLVVNDGSKLHLGAYVAKAKQGELQAGKLIQELAPVVGGKGGGKPEMARGAGSEVGKIGEVLERASDMLKS